METLEKFYKVMCTIYVERNEHLYAQTYSIYTHTYTHNQVFMESHLSDRTEIKKICFVMGKMTENIKLITDNEMEKRYPINLKTKIESFRI